MNIFAASRKEEPRQTSSSPAPQVSERKHTSRSVIVQANGPPPSYQQARADAEEQRREAAAKGQRHIQSPLAAEPAGVPGSTKTATVAQNGTSPSPTTPVDASPSSSGRGTPSRNPPPPSVALRRISCVLDNALPTHLKRRATSTSALSSAAQLVDSPRDESTEHVAPRPPRRSSSFKRLNEIIALQDNSPQNSVQLQNDRAFEQKPAWQWSAGDVQAWLVANAFNQAAKKMTGWADLYNVHALGF